MEPNKSELKNTTLARVEGQGTFRACRGDVITNINDLANCIESLNDNEFKNHVNDKKNDFASWIFHVLKNGFLAKDLDLPTNKGNKANYVRTIRDHVKWLQAG